MAFFLPHSQVLAIQSLFAKISKTNYFGLDSKRNISSIRGILLCSDLQIPSYNTLLSQHPEVTHGKQRSHATHDFHQALMAHYYSLHALYLPTGSISKDDSTFQENRVAHYWLETCLSCFPYFFLLFLNGQNYSRRVEPSPGPHALFAFDFLGHSAFNYISFR